MFQRGGDEMFARHKHHHIIGRVVELALITFAAQRLHMVAHRFGVEIKVPLALPIIIRLKRRLIGVQGHLGVDHQLLLPRHIDDRIGPKAPIGGVHRLFEVEIGVLSQPALFEHVLQRPLSPASARLGGVGQRIAEPLRLALDLFLALAHFLDHAGQLAESIGALGLQFGHLLFVTRQPVAYG